VPVLNVDPNCHCFDPAQTLVLNPAAWTDAPAGQFGKSAPYYNDIRWQRQPAEALSLGRIFRFKESASLMIRIEFQNVFNRVFLSLPNPTTAANPSAPTTRYPNGTLSGGFGYVNTYGGTGTRPRTGQIVARISF
jgi:hypothetical protein